MNLSVGNRSYVWRREMETRDMGGVHASEMSLSFILSTLNPLIDVLLPKQLSLSKSNSLYVQNLVLFKTTRTLESDYEM